MEKKPKPIGTYEGKKKVYKGVIPDISELIKDETKVIRKWKRKSS